MIVFFYCIYLMKLNNKTLFLLIGLLSLCFIATKFSKTLYKEGFNNLENIVGDSDVKLQEKIFKNTEKIVSKDNLGGLDESDVNKMVSKYINRHLLDKEKSVVPPKDKDLSNETLQVVQLIQLNELKCILDKINRLESIEVNE
jgi:hypothetical protein